MLLVAFGVIDKLANCLEWSRCLHLMFISVTAIAYTMTGECVNIDSTVPLCPVLTCFVSKWLACDVVVVVDDDHDDNDNNVINATLAVNVSAIFLYVIAVNFV